MTRLQTLRWRLAHLRAQGLEPVVAVMHPEIWAEIKDHFRAATGRRDNQLSGRQVLGVDIDLASTRRSVVVVLRHPALAANENLIAA